ncbi:hypothetical protein MPDQ_001747 [Monascus purpureus]|uniref:Uncharacterized protein n=1 Tax=Monascus purpureus TaxID=5098 RepID=A0A507R4D4_MONPU|nr:hypothetical protein MPDQ_001747 [Monascus purpureus]BDD59677.1 hypothetical protein MAP00_004872 [Monascus purpureus]
MTMKSIAFRPQRSSGPKGLVCYCCQFSTFSAAHCSPFLAQQNPVSRANRRVNPGALRPKGIPSLPLIYSQPISRRFASKKAKAASTADLEAALRQVGQESSHIRNSGSVPSNESVVQLLQRCEEIASALVLREQDGGKSFPAKDKGNATSSLLNLEEEKSSNRTTTTKRQRQLKAVMPGTNSVQSHLANSVSKIVNGIVKDEKVFISPEALASYTKIQTLLKRADDFPEIFRLYAHKPIPEENSSPVKYHKPNPKGVNSAVPADIANMALDVAIEQKDLPLVLNIIDNTFCTPAFHRAKFFKKAAVPLGALAATPAASYAIASWVSSFQNTMDPSTATGITLAAILAYVGGVSSMGMISIATANDQMERVVWMPGVPLRLRWIREEERAALDKVAVAWGFKDVSMRGEEEGEEWDSLREFIGIRGMILDKTDLMPGMQ